MNAAEKYKVILADDHQLFRSGLRGLLGRYDVCDITAEVGDGKELLDALESGAECDVVLMDIDMPDMNGIEATRQVAERWPDIRIITLSMHGDEEFYFQMVEAGAKGFILKNSEVSEVVQAITAVGEGGSYFSQELLFSLVGSLKHTPHVEHPEDLLSQREREILLLICKGFSNMEIADQLFISKRTVDKHRANILEKTGCRNTANLVVYAIKNKLVEI